MKTVVGVFPSPESAELAIQKLLENHVPAERIVFLTRSEQEAVNIGKRLDPLVDSQSGSAVPARFSRLSVPGVGPVLVRGQNAEFLLGDRSEVAAAVPNRTQQDLQHLTPPTTASEDDSTLFRRVLLEGCSVVVVRSDSNTTSAAACEVLDKLALGVRKTAAQKCAVTVRQTVGAVVADFSGKIALDDGSQLLRETVRAFLAGGHLRILLRLENVDLVDSAGLGELVRVQVAVRNRGGQLRLVSPSPTVRHLLRLTKLDQVFQVTPDEFTALNSLRDRAVAKIG